MESYTYPNPKQATEKMTESSHDELQPLKDMMTYFRDYAKENPEVAALTCFGIGFILGWKLKMW